LGGQDALNELEPNVWGMISGDADANGEVDNPDKDNFWLIDNGSGGYLNSDFNMDSIVDDSDIQFHWGPNAGKGR